MSVDVYLYMFHQEVLCILHMCKRTHVCPFSVLTQHPNIFCKIGPWTWIKHEKTYIYSKTSFNVGLLWKVGCRTQTQLLLLELTFCVSQHWSSSGEVIENRSCKEGPQRPGQNQSNRPSLESIRPASLSLPKPPNFTSEPRITWRCSELR